MHAALPGRPLTLPRPQNFSKPQVASKPCSVDEKVDITLDAQLSADPSGRPLKSFQWAYTSDASDAKLDALVAAANTRTGAR